MLGWKGTDTRLTLIHSHLYAFIWVSGYASEKSRESLSEMSRESICLNGYDQSRSMNDGYYLAKALKSATISLRVSLNGTAAWRCWCVTVESGRIESPENKILSAVAIPLNYIHRPHTLQTTHRQDLECCSHTTELHTHTTHITDHTHTRSWVL